MRPLTAVAPDVHALTSPPPPTAPPSATLVSRHVGFSKKSIEQLGVIKELNALVCITGASRPHHSSLVCTS